MHRKKEETDQKLNLCFIQTVIALNKWKLWLTWLTSNLEYQIVKAVSLCHVEFEGIKIFIEFPGDSDFNSVFRIA